MIGNTEKSPLLSLRKPINGKNDKNTKIDDIISDDASKSTSGVFVSGNEDLEPPMQFFTGVYKQRWYVLIVFSVMNFLQSYLCNVWTVIAVSTRAAFGWSYAHVSLMLNWYWAMYLLLFFPISWLMEAKGLRIPFVLTSGALFLCTILRCISMSPPNVTWLNQVANFFLGIAMPLTYCGGPVVSAIWFPPNWRATVTSFTMTLGYFGYGVCYIFGPLLVSAPETLPSPNLNGSGSQYSNVQQIREEIRMVRLVECAACGLVFLATIIYLPNQPPTPPSLSSALPKLDFLQGVKSMFKSCRSNFWLVCIAQGVSQAIYSTWVSLLTVNFAGFLSQSQIGYLGFVGNVALTTVAVLVGRFADVFVGKMKMMILILLSFSIFSTFWVLLLAMQLIPVTPAQIYVSIILQAATVGGPFGLYFEMCIEMNYPIHEVVTTGIMQVVYNLFPPTFLFIFFIPNIGVSWMNWFLFGSLILCSPLMLFAKENYKRLAVDRRESLIHTLGSETVANSQAPVIRVGTGIPPPIITSVT